LGSGIEGDTGENLYYVTDWAAGKVYAVNSGGTGSRTLINLQKQGTSYVFTIVKYLLVMVILPTYI